MDFRKFRQYLGRKYGIAKAFLFIGYVYENQALYTALQKDGYILVFKPTLKLPNGKVKLLLPFLQKILPLLHSKEPTLIPGGKAILKTSREMELIKESILPRKHIQPNGKVNILQKQQNSIQLFYYDQ